MAAEASSSSGFYASPWAPGITALTDTAETNARAIQKGALQKDDQRHSKAGRSGSGEAGESEENQGLAEWSLDVNGVRGRSS